MVRLAFRGTRGGLERQSLCVTANHALPALRPRRREYESLCAREVELGYRIRTHGGEAVVEEVEPHLQTTAVMEIELEDARSTIYASSHPGSLGDLLFVEVYGELTPPRRDETVKLLRFNRFEGFREALLEAPELRACRMDLERHNFSADLNAHGLGAGKMFVQPQLATNVLAILGTTYRSLRAGDVIVSRAFECMVLEAVRRRRGVRAVYVLDQQPVVLGYSARVWFTEASLQLYTDGHPYQGEASLVVARSFLHLRHWQFSDAESVVTQSTTNVHARIPNHRHILLDPL